VFARNVRILHGLWNTDVIESLGVLPRSDNPRSTGLDQILGSDNNPIIDVNLFNPMFRDVDVASPWLERAHWPT
jgi:hypothetical protein